MAWNKMEFSTNQYLSWDETKLHRWTQGLCGVYFPHAPHDATSSHNSFFLHDLCPTAREPQLSYMDVNAAVLLHFVLIMHTPVCSVNRATIFLEKSPTWHQFLQLSLERVCGFSSCLKGNLLLEILPRTYNFFVSGRRPWETRRWNLRLHFL